MASITKEERTFYDEAMGQKTLKNLDGNVSINTSEFLFYSNNPESIFEEDLADSGKWLCQETVRGNGQIYTWHANYTSKKINSTILVYNPNDEAIVLTATNYGETNRDNWQSDILGWKDYFSFKNPIQITVPAYGYGNLFSKEIQAGVDASGVNRGVVFGVVSRLSVVNAVTGEPSTALLYDLVYENRSDTAVTWANRDLAKVTPHRGLGQGFYEIIDLKDLLINDIMAFSFGYQQDSFNGKDLISISDASGQLDDYPVLIGNYGVQMKVQLSFKNKGASGNFAVFYGSTGGNSFPFVCYNGEFGMPTYNNSARHYGRLEPFEFADIIDFGWIEQNGTDSVEFFTSLAAVGSAPVILGIRRI